LHAQAADRQGNILIRGIVGAQKETALAASTLRSSRLKKSSSPWQRP